MRSRNEIRWGDVYSPTLQPASPRAAATRVLTLPFPLVPPTWIDGIISWGLPIDFRRARVLLSPNLIVVVRGNRKSRASSYVSDMPAQVRVSGRLARHRNDNAPPGRTGWGVCSGGFRPTSAHLRQLDMRTLPLHVAHESGRRIAQ